MTFAALSALRICDLITQAGYPAGAFSLLTGTGKVTGEALASHMDVDKVACVFPRRRSPVL